MLSRWAHGMAVGAVQGWVEKCNWRAVYKEEEDMVWWWMDPRIKGTSGPTIQPSQPARASASRRRRSPYSAFAFCPCAFQRRLLPHSASGPSAGSFSFYSSASSSWAQPNPLRCMRYPDSFASEIEHQCVPRNYGRDNGDDDDWWWWEVVRVGKRYFLSCKLQSPGFLDLRAWERGSTHPMNGGERPMASGPAKLCDDLSSPTTSTSQDDNAATNDTTPPHHTKTWPYPTLPYHAILYDASVWNTIRKHIRFTFKLTPLDPFTDPSPGCLNHP